MDSCYNIFKTTFKEIFLILTTSLLLIYGVFFIFTANYFFLFPQFLFSYRSMVGFSIIVISFEKRIKVLNTFLNFTLTNPPKSLHEIVISWGSDDETIIKDIVQNHKTLSIKNNILLRYSISNDKTLSRKFRDATSIKTSTVLAIDDDILMPPENVEYGFQIWRKHPTQLVGYLARYITIQKAGINGQWDNLTYDVPGSFDRIRLVLTNVAFVSRKLALAFYEQKYSKSLKIVHEMNNCDDIMMNFVAMDVSNLSAVFVLRSYEHIGFDGLSTTTRVSHFLNRTICVNKFYHNFGRYPPIVPKDCIYLK